MGVDFYACSKCGETFPDCGDYQYCDRGHHMCPVCMVEREEGEYNELTEAECPVCQAGGDDLERMTKERNEAIAVATAQRVRAEYITGMLDTERDAAFAAGYARAREEAAYVASRKETAVRTRNCDSYTEGFADGCASCEVTIRALPIPTTAPTRE